MITINTYYNALVGTHTNMHGVEVKNAEGTTDPDEAGYYMQAIGHNQRSLGTRFTGEYPSAQQKEEFRQSFLKGES